MIVIITQIIYPSYKALICKYMKKEVSILKLTKYLNHNPTKLYTLLRDYIKHPNHISKFVKKIARYFVYDKRKRLNIMQKMDILFV